MQKNIFSYCSDSFLQDKEFWENLHEYYEDTSVEKVSHISRDEEKISVIL